MDIFCRVEKTVGNQSVHKEFILGVVCGNNVDEVDRRLYGRAREIVNSCDKDDRTHYAVRTTPV